MNKILLFEFMFQIILLWASLCLLKVTGFTRYQVRTKLSLTNTENRGGSVGFKVIGGFSTQISALAFHTFISCSSIE